MASTLDLSQFTTVWREDFNNPAKSMFTRMWGKGIDTSKPGELTIRSTSDWSDSGAMIPPTGREAGDGYGLYTARVKMDNDAGPYLLTWPGTDVWPGPEYDMVEINSKGVPYSTIHWKGAGNTNAYKSHELTGVDPQQYHVYQMHWHEVGGRPQIDFYVDGTYRWTQTENVGRDAAHGGEDTAMGIGMQNWWNMVPGDDQDWITIDYATFAKEGGNGNSPVQPGPVPVPVTQTIGTGNDSLVLKVSQDFWNGSAQYTVSVDGKQIGGTLTAGASHAAGQSDTITVKGDFAAGAHKVSVNFTNDSYGGSAATDRNLYVDSVSLNGTAIGSSAKSLLGNGAVDIAFTKAASVTQTIGTGNDSLVLKVSQDAWNGNALYTVSVDGKQIGGILTANASHAAGQDDLLTVKGDFAAGAHKVSVNFLNDAYGGSAATDRNLYVDGISLNGKEVAQSVKALMSAGPVDFGFMKSGGQTIGTGSDSLVLKISQDAWNGNAQYTVAVDGKQIGGTLTANASHAAGQDDLLTVKGEFADGPHELTVTFLNDAYGGTPATDRNLYVDGVSYNGVDVAQSVKALMSGGPVDFAFA